MPKKARGKRGSPAAGITRLITSQDEFELSSELVDHLSVYWSYLVRTRSRWTSDKAAAEVVAAEATHKLADLGVTEGILRRLAEAEVVQVSIPFESEAQGWAPRILPWEFLLATATRGLRNMPLTVIRHLEMQNRPPREDAPGKLLFVQSAPGRLREFFAFDAERKIVETTLGLPALAPAVNPTADGLRERLKEHPQVVHIAGVDTHQGRALMGETEDAETGWDGLFLADESGQPVLVYAESFGALFSAARPCLVACKFHRSAARVAAMCVASGAGAAIGFQDEVEDRLAEQFYGTFYEKWRAHDWDLVAAFRGALNSLAVSETAGIVLWTGQSLVQQERKPVSASYAEEREKHRSLTVGTGTGTGSPRDWFAVDVRAPRQINYSLLHNRESLFEKFTICKLQPGFVNGIRVEVELYAGGERFPYRTSVAMTADQRDEDLAKRIHVPLLPGLFRANREDVHTCLYVDVSYAGEELFRDTFQVTLKAVDEWKFDPNDDSRWLASFVVPRDPAVLKIVNAAQRYVSALRDDVGAGFDGYQAVDPEADDPELGVELQVRAIWSALVNDLPLHYINPPPSFTEGTQRLRTPSDVLDNGRGTCIDLALLFASCLEYVEIYPVVFVLKDHAFPGYWRSEESYNRYFSVQAAQSAGVEAAARKTQLTPYDEMMQLINSGDLVPLETVWLTQRRSFREAIDAGVENLIDRTNFGALLDIRSARKNNVTPLPFLGAAL